MIPKSFRHMHYLILLLLIFETASGATYTQKYKILDPSGQESSFLYDGGKLEITCESSNSSAELELVNIANPSKPIEKGKGTFTHSLGLKTSLIGEYFQCAPMNLFHGASLGIRNFQCDPFLLSPKVEDCTESQVCVINKDRSATCKKLDDGICFLADNLLTMQQKFISSLPTLRYACKEVSNTEEQAHGLCHARAMNVAQITGISHDESQCKFFTETLFNGRKVFQDDFEIESKDINLWEVTFKTKGDYDKIICNLATSTDPKLAEATVNGTEKTIQFAPAKINQYKKPQKFRMSCAFHSSRRIIKAISFYVLVIDTVSVAFKVKSTSKVEKPGESVSIGCSCSASSGFYCSLSWKKIAITHVSQANGALKKLIQKKDHIQQNGPYECFGSVYVIGFPSTYKLLELPGMQKSVLINLNKDDFEQPIGTDVGDIGISGSNDTHSVNTIKPNLKKSDDNESSSISKGLVAVIICVVLLIIVGLTIAIIFRRRFKNKKFQNIGSDANLQPLCETDTKEVLLCSAVSTNQKMSKTTKHEKQRCSIDTAKAPTPTKFTQTCQNNDFIELCKSDTKHHISGAMLLSFRKNMNDIVSAADAEYPNVKNSYVKVMNKSSDPTQNKLCEEIKDMVAIRPAATKHLATVRWTDGAIAEETFPFAGVAGVVLYDSIPRRDLTSPVLALGMSYATDNNGRKAYLLAQAPMHREMAKFLDVVFKNLVTLIITLIPDDEVKDTDTSIERYFAYFKKDNGNSETYGSYRLSCVNKIQHDKSYESRQFIIENMETKETKIVSILSFLSWKDRSTIQDPSQLITIRRAMIQLQASHIPDSVTLIHCSAGLGRTGVLVAAINAMNFMSENGTDYVNVFRIVEKLRKERIGAIQTANQFCLLYWSLGEYLNCRFAESVPKVAKQATGKSNRTVVNSLVKGKL